jgi:hypothetical protein
VREAITEVDEEDIVLFEEFQRGKIACRKECTFQNKVKFVFNFYLPLKACILPCLQRLLEDTQF